jgi:predicted DNA-binding transcriptional regulator YafY
MNRTDRLHAITEELRRAGPPGRTSDALAARFEVSARTVKRDVSALQQAGHPIWATGGPGGGYVLDASATLPPVNFTAGEAVAIAAALGRRPDLPFAVDGRSALAKVLDTMPAEARRRAERLAARVWVRRDGAAATPVRATLERALAEETVVVLDYVAADGRRTAKREVDPIYLGIDDDVTYLFAWCHRRRAGRTFRVDRITAAWPTAAPAPVRDFEAVFGRPPPPDVAPVL